MSREAIRKSDKVKVLSRRGEKRKGIACVERCVGWARLWANCRSLGYALTLGFQRLSMLMAHHGSGSHPCPLCDWCERDVSLLCHVLGDHCSELNLGISCDVDNVLDTLKKMNLSFLPKFRNMFTYV